MTELRALEAYEDERGNKVLYAGPPLPSAHVKLVIRGKNNTLLVHDRAKIVDLEVIFDGDGATVEILPTSVPRTGLRFVMRLGHQCTVSVGENVGSEGRTFICVSEGQSVRIGEDCMIATNVELRADDSHAIYDVRTGLRVNHSQSITVGNHVWLGRHAVLMGGAEVGSGSVIGYGSIVTGEIPNNCVAVGAPARVVRTDAAWERPMLSSRPPGVPGLPRGHVKTEAGWNLTGQLPQESATSEQAANPRRGLARLLRRGEASSR